MIVVFVLMLVGIAVWYLVFVVPGESSRHKRKSIRRANMTKPPPAASNAAPTPPVTLGWSALDDQQLTRLLKGSAP